MAIISPNSGTEKLAVEPHLQLDRAFEAALRQVLDITIELQESSSACPAGPP